VSINVYLKIRGLNAGYGFMSMSPDD